jgi:hypothetical protein
MTALQNLWASAAHSGRRYEGSLPALAESNTITIMNVARANRFIVSPLVQLGRPSDQSKMDQSKMDLGRMKASGFSTADADERRRRSIRP